MMHRAGSPATPYTGQNGPPSLPSGPGRFWMTS